MMAAEAGGAGREEASAGSLGLLQQGTAGSVGTGRARVSSPFQDLKRGQRVRILKRDMDAIRRLHVVESCRWNPIMELCVGLVGVVSRKTTAGHLRVVIFAKREDGKISQRKFAWHPACVGPCMDYSFHQGMIVYVTEDLDLLLQHNANWIGHNDKSAAVAGKTGQVWEVSFGEIMVSVDGMGSIGISPASLIPVYDSRVTDSPEFSNNFQTSRFGDPNILCSYPQLLTSDPIPTPEQIQLYLASAKHGHQKFVTEFLYKFKGYVDVTMPQNSTTALMLAASTGQNNMIHILCLSGGSVERRGADGMRPIHHAVKGGHHMSMVILMGYGGNVMDKADNNMTCLHLAVLHHTKECFQALADREQADVNAQLILGGETVFQLCVDLERRDMLRYLLSKRAKDIDCSLVNSRRFNLLHISALHGHVEAVNFCISKSPGLVNVGRSDGSGTTPLHCAAQNGHGEVMEVLLGERGGGDPDARDSERATPLMTALRSWREVPGGDPIGRLYTIFVLMRAGADVNAKGYPEESTPLHEGMMNVNQVMETGRPFPAELVCNLQSMEWKDMYDMKALVDECKDFPQLAAVLFMLGKGASLDATNISGNKPTFHLKDPRFQYLWTHFGNLYLMNGKRDGEREKCVKCGEVADVLFHPCGHRHSCRECAKAVSFRFCACNAPVRRMTTLDGSVVDGVVEGSGSGGDVVEENKALRRKLEDAENAVLCVVCMDRKCNMFFNCGHMVCHECGRAEKLNHCPTCRNVIKKRHVVFPSW